MRASVLIFLLSASLCAAETYRWPAGYEGKQKLEVKKLEASKMGPFGFESENYRFYSDTELSNAEWRSIMIVCEGLRGAMAALPLKIIKPGESREIGTVRIFAEESAYLEAGGFEQTVGTYRSRGGEVLIWRRGLNEPDPEQGRFRLSKARQYDLLVHELSHQITGREFRRMPMWFSEGLAEYMAAAHDSPGRYSFKDPATAIRTHVRKYLGDMAKRDRFGITPLEVVVNWHGRDWSEDTRRGEGHGPFLKYVSAVLLVHYFCHLDPKSDQGEVIRDFLAALRAGQPASRATVEQLLRGRSLKSIEAEIEKFWQSKGLRVEFQGK